MKVLAQFVALDITVQLYAIEVIFIGHLKKNDAFAEIRINLIIQFHNYDANLFAASFGNPDQNICLNSVFMSC